MHDAPSPPSANTPTSVETVRCATARLDLPLTDDALQRVTTQWARLQTMASVLAEEPLSPADEPAPIFTP